MLRSLVCTLECAGLTLGLAAQQAPLTVGVAKQDALLDLLNTPVESASKRRQKSTESPQAIEVLTAEQIRASGVFRLIDALKLMTSVQVFEFGKDVARLTIRGTVANASMNNVQVLVDGVPLFNTETYYSVPFNLIPIPLEAIERVEVVRGPSSSLYGANAQVGVTQAAFFPALTLSANAGYRNQDWSSLVGASNVFWSVGPTLVQSVFDGGLRRAARADALAARDVTVSAYRQTVLTAMLELEDNLVAAVQLATQAQVQAQALQAAQRNLAITEAQYRAGAVSYLAVVTAQTSELSAERGLIDVQTRRLVAINALLKNLAGRWPQPVLAGPVGQ